MNPKNKRMLEKDGYYIISNHDYNNYNPNKYDGVVGVILGFVIIALALMFIA